MDHFTAWWLRTQKGNNMNKSWRTYIHSTFDVRDTGVSCGNKHKLNKEPRRNDNVTGLPNYKLYENNC